MDERDEIGGHGGMDESADEVDRPMDSPGESAADDGLTEALGAAYPSALFPRDEIEAGIRASVAGRVGRARGGAGAEPWWRGPAARSALAAAAALVVFIGGMEYGRRTSLPVPGAEVGGAPVVAPGATAASASVPLAIQNAGSRYVASLARFSGEAARLSAEERRMAREVALSALYGAALELLREAGEDETLEAVTEMVARRRGVSGGPDDGPLSF